MRSLVILTDFDMFETLKKIDVKKNLFLTKKNLNDNKR